MPDLDLRPYTSGIKLFPGSKGVVKIVCYGAPADTEIKARVLIGNGNTATELKAELQPITTKIDSENWEVVFDAERNKSYDSERSPYSLDLLMDDEVFSAGAITCSRENRTTEYVAGTPIHITWGGDNIIYLTPLGARDQAYFEFNSTDPKYFSGPAIKNMELEHRLNCDFLRTTAFDSNGVQLFDVVCYPLVGVPGKYQKDYGKLNFPDGLDIKSLVLEPLFRS